MAKSAANQAAHSVTSTPAPPGLKRRKVEEEDVTSLTSKKQRTRVSFSCGECHRRKQKCDRQIPCSHCIARKVPELCKAYTPGKSDQDMNVRLARLEHIIEIALPQYCNIEAPALANSEPPSSTRRRRSVSTAADDDNRSHSEEHDPSGGGSFQAGKWYGTSVSGSVAPASVLEQLENVVSPISNQEGNHRERGRMHSRQSSQSDPNNLLLGLPQTLEGPSSSLDLERTPADNLKNLVLECGVSPQLVSELLQELPPQRMSDVLIEYYFTSINWTRYPVSERDFRAAYTSLRSNHSGANHNDVRFLPLLFVVLAIAVRLAPDRIAGDAKARRLTSVRYYWCSRRSLLIAAAIQPDSLDIVLTRLLSARFLTFDRRITECWSQLGAAVRTAQALGLHRDGATMGLDPSQVEYRRRIWSYLYHADRSYALVLGRPNAIQDEYTSTKPPSNIDDDIPVAQLRNPPSLSHPTPMTFVILRNALASIIGHMVHHFQQVRSPAHYQDVIALDEDLIRFVKGLPPHFALEPDTSLDAISTYIPVHRYLLITEVLFVRISLHRPYLLRRLESDRFIRSRTACFESAIKDFQTRQAFRDSIPSESRNALCNAYRDFQTAMISGIYLVIDPHGRDAPAMHAILDAFMAEHQDMKDMDETTRRELKTIEFLKAKASQMEGRAGMLRTGNQNGDSNTTNALPNGDGHSTEAQLLLSLQQSCRANPLSPSRLTFPSLVNALNSPHASPSTSYATPAHTHPSPFHRRQLSNNGDGYVPSPAGSSSPSADDESAAQSLLDHWCNTVSNGPLDVSGSIAGMNWGPSVDHQFWTTNPPATLPVDSTLLHGLDGSDWNYWETLVSQIPVRGGAPMQ